MIRTGLAAALAILSLAVAAEDVITQGAGGGVNWTQGYIWADGYGVAPDEAPERKQRLLARRAAQVDAYRNLAEFVNGVRVSSETVVQEMVLASDTVRTRMEAVVKGAGMSTDHYQNNVAQVTMRIYFDGEFASVVNSASAGKDRAGLSLRYSRPLVFLADIAGLLRGFGMPAAHAGTGDDGLIHSSSDLEFANRLLERASQQEPTQLLRQLEQDVEAYRVSSRFTGLLVDARSVPEFELATIPRIRDPDGNVIYPADTLLSGPLAAKRPVSYDFDVEDAVRNARIAVKPYVIQAQGVFRSRNSDLVISESDARFISRNDQFKSIINHAGVMIVVAQ